MSKTVQIPEAWKEHDRSIKPYLWKHRALSWTAKIITLGLLIWALFSRTMFQWQVTVINWLPDHRFLQWLVFFGGLGLISEMINLPIGAAKHAVERSYSLSKQSYGSWLADRAKGWVLGAILGTVMFFILFECIKHFPTYWWVIACTLFVLLSVVLAQLTPVLLIPIFYKLNPMEPGPLKERLLKLCEKFKIHVQEVYHLGLGEKTEKGNAAFVGLGRTKRIIIGDTLYQKFSPEEVEAVFAHELGHQVHSDLWKGIFISSGLMYLAFFLANFYMANFVLGVDPGSGQTWTLSDPFWLLVFFIILSLIQMPLGLVQVLFSRYCEREADSFASDTIGMGQKLGEALERLTYQNRGQFKPNALWEFLTYSHPAPWRRILKLR